MCVSPVYTRFTNRIYGFCIVLSHQIYGHLFLSPPERLGLTIHPGHFLAQNNTLGEIMHSIREFGMQCRDCRKVTDIYFDQRAGDVICRECGVVMGERFIDDGQEWRTFTTEESRTDPNRCGDAASPLLSSKSSMNTMIEGGDNKKQTGRLQKAQSMTGKESASEVALKACFARVREISQDLGLPSSIQEDSCLLLRRVEDEGLFKVKKDPRGKAMCAAVTYITCRTWGVSRSMKDVSKAIDVPLRDVNKACKHVFKNMDIDKGTVRGTHLIPQLCDKLGVPAFVTMAAQNVAQKASELDLVGGMMPSSVAAAAVLLICSCWKPAACCDRDGTSGRRGGGRAKGNKGIDQGVEEEVGMTEKGWVLGPGAMSIAQGVTVEAMKKPFRAMFEQRVRLIKVEFLERYASKGITFDTLEPVLV